MARRKKVRKLNVFLGVIVIIALVAISIGIYTLVNNPNVITALWNKNSKNAVNQAQIQNEVEEEPVPEDIVINIVGIGDALCHSQNFKDAYNSETGAYDFSPMFKNVTKYFDDATVAVGNLETTLAGADRGYSGYPTFNSPDELAYDLKEMTPVQAKADTRNNYRSYDTYIPQEDEMDMRAVRQNFDDI